MKKFIFLVLICSVLITGCASNNNRQTEEDSKDNYSQQKQPRLEYLMGSNDWSVVSDITDSPQILEAYQFAVEHPEVLNYMPCYCGCYEEDGHTSNTHCFVDSVEGEVALLDTMGFG